MLVDLSIFNYAFLNIKLSTIYVIESLCLFDSGGVGAECWVAFIEVQRIETIKISIQNRMNMTQLCRKP